MVDFVQLHFERVKNHEHFAMNFLHLNTMQVQYQGNNDCLLKLYSTFLIVLECLSTSPWDQGNSAPVVFSLMFRASQKCNSASLTNSPLLLVRNLSTEPYTATQFFMIEFAMYSGFFDGTLDVTDSLVALSIICSEILPL